MSCGGKSTEADHADEDELQGYGIGEAESGNFVPFDKKIPVDGMEGHAQ